MTQETINPNWLQRRILIPTLLIGLITIGAPILYFSQLVFNIIDEEISHELEATEAFWQHEMQQHISQLEALNHSISNNPDIRKALIQADRDKIIKQSTPLFEFLKKNHNIDTMGFLDKDRKVILRSHRKNKHGDIVKIPILAKAQQTGKMTTGLDIGPGGRLGLRSVSPIFNQNELKGFIVIGAHINNILSKVDALFNLEHLLLVDKNHIKTYTQDSFTGKNRFNWQQYPDYLVMSQSITTVPSPINQLILDKQISKLSHTKITECDNCYYSTGSVRIKNSLNDEIAVLITMRDMQYFKSDLLNSFYSISFLSLLLFSALLFFLYKITNKTEQESLDHYNHLEHLNHRLQLAKHEWNDAFDAINNPIFIHDSQFRVIRANQAYAEQSQMSFKDIIGKPYWQCFPKIDGPFPGCGAAMTDLSISPVCDRLKETIHLADGRVFISHTYITTNSKKEYKNSIHMLEDITEKRHMELAIKTENRARRIISGSNHCLVHATNKTILLQNICNLIENETDFPMAWIVLKENDTSDSIKIAAYAHNDDQDVDFDKLDMCWVSDTANHSACVMAVKTGQLQITTHDQTDACCDEYRMMAQKFNFTSTISYPLIHREHILGSLTIAANTNEAFTSQETELLQELADDIAYGIVSLDSNNARQYAEESRNIILAELEQSMQKTVQAMANAVEVRDPYTAGHQRHVADLAVSISQEMGLDPHDIEGIQIAATIHDLGKIYVPAEILSKPGSLTPIEFELIKSHAQVGYDILKDIDFPWPVADMIHQHHERLDGSGYPQGLKGEEIILGARIIGIADTLEAIAAHRPYRASLGLDFALSELERGRGITYDKKIVDTCIKLFRDKNYKLNIT